jgi:sortase A
MTRSRWRRLSRWLEGLLLGVALAAFGRVYLDGLDAERARASARLALSTAQHVEAHATVARAESTSGVTAASPPERRVFGSGPPNGKSAPTVAAETSLVGELVIPRLNVSTLVFDTSDPAGLRHAAGHLRGTPLPWQPGNSAISGHRDSAFRALKNAQAGDDVQLVTTRGRFDYRVTRAFAVYPDEVWVLDTQAAALTLITCFPFVWIGPAPERWIVQAERSGYAAPDTVVSREALSPRTKDRP